MSSQDGPDEESSFVNTHLSEAETKRQQEMMEMMDSSSDEDENSLAAAGGGNGTNRSDEQLCLDSTCIGSSGGEGCELSSPTNIRSSSSPRFQEIEEVLSRPLSETNSSSVLVILTHGGYEKIKYVVIKGKPTATTKAAIIHTNIPVNIQYACATSCTAFEPDEFESILACSTADAWLDENISTTLNQSIVQNIKETNEIEAVALSRPAPNERACGKSVDYRCKTPLKNYSAIPNKSIGPNDSDIRHLISSKLTNSRYPDKSNIPQPFDNGGNFIGITGNNVLKDIVSIFEFIRYEPYKRFCIKVFIEFLQPKYTLDEMTVYGHTDTAVVEVKKGKPYYIFTQFQIASNQNLLGNDGFNLYMALFIIYEREKENPRVLDSYKKLSQIIGRELNKHEIAEYTELKQIMFADTLEEPYLKKVEEVNAHGLDFNFEEYKANLTNENTNYIPPRFTFPVLKKYSTFVWCILGRSLDDDKLIVSNNVCNNIKLGICTQFTIPQLGEKFTVLDYSCSISTEEYRAATNKLTEFSQVVPDEWFGGSRRSIPIIPFSRTKKRMGKISKKYKCNKKVHNRQLSKKKIII